MIWDDQRPDDSTGGALLAEPPIPIVTVEPHLFREAMSRLGAAVHVVTTAGPGGKAGFTATAVTSVSDKPATLLVCLNRASRNNSPLFTNQVLCVNTLPADAQSLADLFAGRTGVYGEARFATGVWTTLKTGSPILTTAVAALDCRVLEAKSVASHYVYFCAVEAIRLGGTGAALVYHEREYKQV
jgi:flavin reductase (DIM6/NTAB) family NADH-FMN oxidoreductase RutF